MRLSDHSTRQRKPQPNTPKTPAASRPDGSGTAVRREHAASRRQPNPPASAPCPTVPLTTESPYAIGVEELVLAAKAGGINAAERIIASCPQLAKAEMRRYFLPDGDQDDLLQEAMIGLYKAVRTFTPGRGGTFTAFARLCVRSQVLAAIRRATRCKHAPLNTSVSLYRVPPADDSNKSTLLNTLPEPAAEDPAALIIDTERVSELKAKIVRTLTPLELSVIRLHCRGQRYTDIARRLQKPAKVVDNSLQRAKQKLFRCWIED